MSQYDFARTELNEIATRLQRCEYVVRTTPEDCASAEANLRYFVQEDLTTLYNRFASDRSRYSEKEYDELRDRVVQLQAQRRQLVEKLPHSRSKVSQ